MTRLIQRATLLVALHLFTTAVTAYAECAWVLWQTFIGFAGGQQFTTYMQADVYDKRADCVTLLDRME